MAHDKRDILVPIKYELTPTVKMSQ